MRRHVELSRKFPSLDFQWLGPIGRVAYPSQMDRGCGNPGIVAANPVCQN